MFGAVVAAETAFYIHWLGARIYAILFFFSPIIDNLNF